MSVDQQARESNFNPETQRDLKVLRVVKFEVCGVPFELRFRMALYVYERLTSADWDDVMHHVTARAERYVRNAAENGCLATPEGKAELYKLTQQYARQRLYEKFVDYQARAGNDAWEVPLELQEHSLR
jgi:hypothetical protein